MRRRHLYSLIARNKRGTIFFVLLLSAVLATLGLALGVYFDWNWWYYVLFAVGIIVYNLVLYRNSDRIALAVSGARPAPREGFRQLHNIVEEVALAAGIIAPRVFVIDSDAPNAFATGRDPNHASIAVTRGLLAMMDREELQGVVAHEIAHIRNYDILIMTVVAIVGGLVILLRDLFLRWGLFFGGRRRRGSPGRGGGQAQLVLVIVGLVLAILAPLVVALIRAAVSRQREYLADAAGVYIVRNPHGLSRALEKIAGTRQRMTRATNATAHMYIASPFAKDRQDGTSWLASHPPLRERVARLRSLALEADGDR